MSILAKIGGRLYEFESIIDKQRARAVYARCTGGQDEFEEAMENAEIDFYIADFEGE